MQHQQNSIEWEIARAGKITSSPISVIMGKTEWTDTAKKYAHKLAIERITGKPLKQGYKSNAMERGHIMEPIARKAYEIETLNIVKEMPFIQDTEFSGGSVDGMINNNEGNIEIKCPDNPEVHFQTMINKKINSTYQWQIQHNMLVTETGYCDFVSYCPFFEQKPLVIIRVNRDTEKIKLLIEKRKRFNDFINTITQKYEQFR